MKLRPYQTGAVGKLRFSLAGGKKRVMLYSPTGSGKTEMGMEIIRLAIAKGSRVAFIANRIELVVQASRRFHAAGIPHGIIQGENSHNLNSPVLICSIQTVAKRGLPDDIRLIVIDEAHGCAGSKAYRNLLKRLDLVPAIGLSATPFTRGLGKVFEDLVSAATIRDLIEQGHLCDCDIYSPDEPDLSGVKIVAGDYHEGQLAEAVNKPRLVGGIVSHWLRLARGVSTVCFATNRAHSQAIVNEFVTAGIKAAHIDCYTEEEERQRVLGAFARGEITVLSNVALLAEGWDCPATACMILARPTKSLTRYIQMAGRVLRPFHGKDRALILDHSGTALRLGYPTDDLPLELDDGAPKKSAAGKTEPPKPTKCSSCTFVKPAGVHACPECGFAPQRKSDVEVQDGELVPLSRDRAKASRDEKQRVFSELTAIQLERGYREGWTANQYRNYFGCWPRGLSHIPARPSLEIIKWVRGQAIRHVKRLAKEAGGHHASA